MIIRWKCIDASNYVARWQGIDLALKFNETGDNRWSVRVCGERCRQRWVSPVIAMEVIDAALGREIVKFGAELKVRAVQHPPYDPAHDPRIVRHA